MMASFANPAFPATFCFIKFIASLSHLYINAQKLLQVLDHYNIFNILHDPNILMCQFTIDIHVAMLVGGHIAYL